MILIVTQTFAPSTGGMESYMTGLATQLANAGQDVVVFADGKSRGFVPDAPYKIHCFKGWRPLRRWKKRRAVTTFAAAQKIDGIFCDSWKSVESLPEKLNAPIAILAHGAEYPRAPKPAKTKRISDALRRAEVIIANSRFTADAAGAFLPRGDARVTIINPPVEPLQSPSPKAEAKMRKLIGSRKPVLSILARLEPRKGADRVIAALPELILRHPKLVFMIAGSGDDKARLKLLARQHGVTSHVEFLGRISGEEKAALLSSTDIFAMPVRRVGTSVEGFGISYVEAAWFGAPSLGGKDGGAADAVIDGKTGLLCDGADQADVTEKLLTLLDKEDKRRALGQAAQARARNELTWPALLPRFLATLNIRSDT